MKKIFSVVLLFCFFQTTHAQIRLPRLVRDSMILQRDTKIQIWGWSSANEKITVKFNNKTYKTKADQAGNWSVLLPALVAGGPYMMELTGKNKLTLKDILVGDVWFCSGQSNMVHQLNIHDVTYANEIATANHPAIRQFWIPTMTNLQEARQDFPAGNWKAAVGEDIRPFSAVAYFFAKKLYEKYQVPIGIINASVGGTPIEAWTSEEGLKEMSSMTTLIQKNKDTAYVNSTNRAAAAANRPPVSKDAGLSANIKWFDPNYQPLGWKPINIPGYWEDQGIKDLNGTVWYRKEINIPASIAGGDAKIFLGRIVDAGELYINGIKVDNTTYQYPQRRYKVVPGILKAGKNLFVVRVTNTAGKGGFVPDKPYCLFAGSDTIDLKGTWHYKVGEVFIPRPPAGPFGIAAQNQPAALYNAMVAPAIKYAIRGFCWYQGESNAGRPDEYAQLQIAQINDWRNKWGQGSLPFLYVQLPGFMDYNYVPSESNWAKLREGQLKALTVPNTAMAVAIDLGEWNDIHPDNKKDVGDRLALAALKLSYGEDLFYSGPVCEKAMVDGNKIIIQFSHTGSGLVTNDGEAPAEFAIAGADKKFVWANARIESGKVIVWNDNVKEPLYVRYAWADNPVNPNLYNKEKLPASPFRTDK
ncbi:MAG: sialate O-acetylesterase [Chitinophagaceae bacterium]|nr:sialate O-acetylesterase [Chitinophagaceae bacterium]